MVPRSALFLVSDFFWNMSFLCLSGFIGTCVLEFLVFDLDFMFCNMSFYVFILDAIFCGSIFLFLSTVFG